MTNRFRRRAYILLEAMVGGAIVATGLLAMVVQIGAARDRSVLAQRRAIAVQLALSELEQRRSRSYAELAAITTSDTVVVGTSPFRRTIEVTTGTDPFSIGSLAATAPYKHIRVGIAFGVAHDQEIEVESRVYAQPAVP